MKTFYKKVNTDNREEMLAFLKNHEVYDHPIAHYANCIKIHQLGYPSEIADKLYDFLDCPDDADEFIHERLRAFGKEHGWRYQAWQGGRLGGWLILYTGELVPTQYRSVCTNCGQKNFRTIEETKNNVCGLCGEPARRNIRPDEPMAKEIRTHWGEYIDMSELDSLDNDELKDRVHILQQFDLLTDQIVKDAAELAKECEVTEETIWIPQTVKRIRKKG